MFDLNKLSEKQLAYLLREAGKALKNKMHLKGNPMVTSDYGRWLFTSKNNYELNTAPNASFDVGYPNNYVIKTLLTKNIIGNHVFNWSTRTDSIYYIFIILNEQYDLLKAIKMFFHAHAHSLGEVQVSLRITINTDGQITSPQVGFDQGLNNQYFHIDSIEDITDSLQ